MSAISPDPRPTGSGGPQAAAISNALVRLHREHYGKGPTKAKTYLLDDLVVCVLEGGALRLEETLQARGQRDLVHAVRSAFRDVLDVEFRTHVERETGRKVRVFLSQFDVQSNVGAELFFLEPDER